MTTLLILMTLFALLGYALKEYYQIKLGSPASTPPKVIDEIVDFLAQYNISGRFIDMGSGWGHLVLALARRLPDWQIDGIEASPTPWLISNFRSIGRSFSNYRFFIGRMENHALQKYDIVFLHQSQKRLAAMTPRLVKALQKDCFVLTYPYPIPRMPQSFVLASDTKEKLYLYPGLEALEFMNKPAAVTPAAETIVETAPLPDENDAFEDVPPATEQFAEQGTLAFDYPPLNATD